MIRRVRRPSPIEALRTADWLDPTTSGGRVAVAEVKAFLHADRRPDRSLPGLVSGPGAGWMTGDGDYWWLLTPPVTLGLSGAAGWSLRLRNWALRRQRKRPRDADRPRSGATSAAPSLRP